MCKKIHRGGNAEQFNADKKYKETVAVAVEVCADDTKGQTCYICTHATTLTKLKRFEESRSLMRKMIPVSRRVLGEVHRVTLTTRCCYGEAIYEDSTATLDDLREAVATLEDTIRSARRVFGNTNPLAQGMECYLDESRAALRARE